MRLFMPEIREDEIAWKVVDLCERLGIRVVDKVPACCDPDASDAVALLVPRFESEKAACYLMVRRPEIPIYINGMSDLPVTALYDRDELSLGPKPEQRLFYSIESPRQIVPFHEGAQPVFCARSKTEITEGMPAVRCACGLWYLETKDLPAYSYAETCACGRPTTLGCTWEPQPVRKPVVFDVVQYRQDVCQRLEALNAGKKQEISLAG